MKSRNPPIMQIRAHARRLAKEDVDKALGYLDDLPEPDGEGAQIVRLDLLNRADRREEARDIARELAQRNPDRADVQRSVAAALIALRFPADAVGPAWRHVQLAPNDLEALRAMSEVLQAGWGEEHRSEFLQRLGELAEVDSSAAVEYGSFLQNTGDLDRCWQYDQDLVRRFPEDFRSWARRAATAVYRDDVGPEEILRITKDFGRKVETSVRPMALGFRNVPDSDRRIRLGFLSNDLYMHVVADFAHHLIQGLDRDRFEVFMYSTSDRSDYQTDRYRESADHFRELPEQRPDVIVRRVFTDQIDVLVDLSGLTMGALAGSLAYRPAPVQITYLGSPSTTGLTRVQHRLVDLVTDPVGLAPATTEGLLRMSGCFVCYSPLREFDPPQAAPEGPVTFGCLGNTLKISPTVAKLWARVMDAVPGSNLLIAYRMMRIAEARDRLAELLGQAGADLSRVQIEPGRDGVSFQRIYHRIHVSLDTYPYTGTTTTCESLWMGVPVVTLAGDMHRSRVSASLLTHAGFPEWVAVDGDDFVERAKRLAETGPRSLAERTSVHDRFAASPVCDAPGFVERFSDAVCQAWAQWCADPR